MKKLIFILFSLLLVINLSAIELGVGYTADAGVHFMVNKFELQSMFDKDFIGVGLRWYPIVKGINIISQEFDLYLGGEGNYIISELLDYGYTFGVFSGLGKRIYRGLNLGIDLGIFICTLKGWEEFTDWGLAINTKLTWRFKI